MKKYEFVGKCAGVGDKILDRIAVLLAILLLLLGTYAIWDNFIAARGAFSQEILKYKPDGDSKNLVELHKLNPDVCAWLTIDRTHIDYPVVQGKDNLEYLNMDPLKQYKISGSLFLDCYNSPNFADKYNVVYGHHMSEGAMFGDVVKFVNKRYFNKHKKGTLTLLDKKYKIKIFACVKAAASDGIIYNTGAQSEEYVNKLLSYVESNSIQYRDISVTGADKIIALSTCSEAETNGRVIVFGKLVEVTSKSAVD